jgi:2-phospho-L-lactate transferase/gluconeogenesis factor (CofD/UPF0052 family)
VSGPVVTALGGGHGLAATLTALRFVTDDITAVVTVADDGGSSGRLREEFGVLPPGDLRMALAALCSDSEWGHTWRDVLQHRFAGDGPLGGHALGNLLIVALWELHEDPVAGLDLVGRLLQAQGRVLPAAAVPGSWFTSVTTHLLVPEVREALEVTRARRLLILNLDPGAGETAGFSAARHLESFAAMAPGLRLDAVLADPGAIDDRVALEETAARLGAVLHVMPVAGRHAHGEHDPLRYAAALRDILYSPRASS